MKGRNFITAGVSAAGILVLILDGQTAFAGAEAGLQLCLKSIIPTLFPFLFFCAVLTDALWGSSFPGLGGICRKLGIPSGAQPLLIAAVLGGYPAGAQMIGQAYRGGKLKDSDAAHLLTFCSNAGPAFLFGMTAVHFSSNVIVWALWFIQILSAAFVGITGHGNPTGRVSMTVESRSIPQILNQTVKAMGILCGWIILFQIVIRFLNRWILWYFPETVQVMVSGILELSSGCSILSRIPSEFVRFLVCSTLLSFGGISVLMQTASVIAPLPLGVYVQGKLMQTVFSILLSLLYLRFGLGMLFLAAILVFLIPRRKKEVDLSGPWVYNKKIITGRDCICCSAKK